MPKLIVGVPSDLLADAKVMAAKTGNPLSSIILGLLAGFVKNEAGPLTGNYEILLAYSLGRISAGNAAHQLHLDSESALNKLTLEAGLPIPRLGLQETEAMRKRFAETMDKAAAVPAKVSRH